MSSAVLTGSSLGASFAGPVIAIAVADPALREHLLESLQAVSLEVADYCDAEQVEELIASLERSRPDILILGLNGLPTDPVGLVSRIAGLDAPPKIIALNDGPDGETILSMMRAGASEFVYPPLTAGAFADAMQRVIAQCGLVMREERTTGAVIGFVSAKGGCGATTLACHAAAYLRQCARKEVLLADLDAASGIAASIMQTATRYSLEDAVQNLHRMDLKLWKAMVATSPSGVDLVPAPQDSVDHPATISNRVPSLVRFWRFQYDVTLLDLGHGITQALLDELDSIDTLVLVATNEVLALRQAKQMIQALATRNFGANRLKLVINRMPRRARIQLPELEKVMGHPIHSAIPNDYIQLNDAYSEPRLVDLNSELGIEIGKFAARLTGITPVEKKARTFFGFGGRK